jgi:hypothetical protein
MGGSYYPTFPMTPQFQGRPVVGGLRGGGGGGGVGGGGGG